MRKSSKTFCRVKGELRNYFSVEIQLKYYQKTTKIQPKYDLNTTKIQVKYNNNTSKIH